MWNVSQVFVQWTVTMYCGLQYGRQSHGDLGIMFSKNLCHLGELSLLINYQPNKQLNQLLFGSKRLCKDSRRHSFLIFPGICRLQKIHSALWLDFYWCLPCLGCTQERSFSIFHIVPTTYGNISLKKYLLFRTGNPPIHVQYHQDTIFVDIIENWFFCSDYCLLPTLWGV